MASSSRWGTPAPPWKNQVLAGEEGPPPLIGSSPPRREGQTPLATAGGSPHRNAGAPGPPGVNIPTRLREMARARPYAMAVASPSGRDRAGRARHTHWTFRQLDRQSDAAARILELLPIGRGVRTVLMIKP